MNRKRADTPVRTSAHKSAVCTPEAGNRGPYAAEKVELPRALLRFLKMPDTIPVSLPNFVRSVI